MRRRLPVFVLALALALPPAVAGDAGEVRTRSFELLNQGVNAYRKGQYEIAIEKLEAASNMALNNFRIYFYLGLSLNGGRRYHDALEALAVALDLDPQHLQTHVAVGDAWLKLGDLSEAEASYTLALKLRPEYAPALDGMARIEVARSATRDAETTFRRALNSDPGYAPAYSHLGSLYLELGKFEEAVDLLEEAVSVRPDFAAGMNRLALAYSRLGLQNQAIATIRRAMELEPSNPEHMATFGRLQLDQEFPDSARALFERALHVDPAFPDARRGLAELARREGDYDAAVGQLQVAIDDPRVDALVRSRLEAFRDRIADERERFVALSARFEEGVADASDHAAMAELFARRARWDDAVSYQRGAGESVAARERLAFLLFQAQAYLDARAAYRELAAETGRADLYVNLGVAEAVVGDDAAAIAAYRAALEREPDSRPARLYLGNALLRAGRRAEARAAYEAFLADHRLGEDAERVRRILAQIGGTAS